MPYFEDVELGDEIGPLQTEATDYGVLEFCQVWDNRGPSRFTDQAMAEESRLPGPIVPGIMSMGIMARLLTDWAGTEALKDLDIVFLEPAVMCPERSGLCGSTASEVEYVE